MRIYIMHLNYFNELNWGDFIISDYNNLIMKVVVAPIKLNNDKSTNVYFYILKENGKICIKYTSISGNEYLYALKTISAENNFIDKTLPIIEIANLVEHHGYFKKYAKEHFTINYIENVDYEYINLLIKKIYEINFTEEINNSVAGLDGFSLFCYISKLNIKLIIANYSNNKNFKPIADLTNYILKKIGSNNQFEIDS